MALVILSVLLIVLSLVLFVVLQRMHAFEHTWFMILIRLLPFVTTAFAIWALIAQARKH